ncbi:MAG TPA: PQQ-binding-like beta-propeller repeat protein [Sedimentisphaerales bacterium]|nr:PQQ-binding-like beta-propeller repeat protein [Sedimentisphaerales bacterium]
MLNNTNKLALGANADTYASAKRVLRTCRRDDRHVNPVRNIVFSLLIRGSRISNGVNRLAAMRRSGHLCLLILIGFWLLPVFILPTKVHGHDWPMWRYDAGRRAASSEELPAQMHLQWVRELATPKPAWPKSQYRLQFDASYEPVVAGKTIFVGSMVCDRVTAYDTETGIEKWRFYTDGPVRFAPVVYKDKLYFASDDGYLYCLNAENGSLIRKFLGGPAQNKVIGNDRLISMWPMRGGPVLYEGKIYFAASIWPFMGTFIHAIDAETGEAIWTNSGSGTTYIMQPHSSPAFAGVAPQGYLVATEDKLLVSGGRSVPAAYDRKTGQFLYYNMNEYGKTGACDVMASGDHFFNRGAIYRLSDGIVTPRAPASVIADEVIIGKKSNTIMAYKLEPGAKKAESLWQAKVPSELKRIFLKAGSRLYGSGEEGIIFAVDIPLNNGQSRVSWQAKVDGEVWNMLAADGKLFVITLEGKLYCFADKRIRPKHHAPEVKPLPADSRQWKDKVRQISEMTDQRDGYCLLLGLGTGELLYQLVNQSDLHIVALDPEPGKVEAMRRRLDEAGLYGTRVAVHLGDITTMQLPPYMANLVVSEYRSQKSAMSSVLFERVFHSLRPYGGTACFLAPQSEHIQIMRQVLESKLPGSEITSSGEYIMLTRAGPLTDSADWTHQYGDSANTVMSRDKRVKAPLGLLWFGGPSNDKILPRHGHGPSPQVVGGRLFIEGRNMLRAVDVYTGRLLWERDFTDLGKYYDNTSHQPGANEIGSNYVSVSDGVYVVYGDKIHVLDPATGRTSKEFSMPHEDRPRWGTIAVWEDLLLATASPINIPLTDKPVRTKLPENMQPIIKKEADWQYLAGTHPNSAWTQPDYNAETWRTSAAGFGYNYTDNKTMLKDMKDHYTAVYIRKSFSVPEPEDIQELGLVVKYDDAFIAYLNGKEILRVGVFNGSGARASDIEEHERKDWEYFKIDNHRNLLRDGINVLAIEGHNRKVDSRGFTLNPYLVVLRNGKPGVNRNIETIGLPAPVFASTPVPAFSVRAAQVRAQVAQAQVNNISGITVNADYASGSKMLVAMDRHSGEALWKHDAEFSFRHNAIAMAANKVFCIDGMSTAKLAYFKRRGLNFEKERTLYALDAWTGELLWKTNEGIFGTWLGYSVEHDVLLQAGSRSGDRARDEAGKGMVAYRGSDGKVLWRTDESYKGPPILYHNWVITQTGGGSGSAPAEAKVFDLLTGKYVMREHSMTGEIIPWTWVRFKGCNTAIASENLLTFRSASGAFVDLTRGQGTASIGGFKSGCTSNLIIANGVLNAPDYTRTCTCSYQNQASLALVYMPEVVHWTFDYYASPSTLTPVKQVGINFGAPGNHYSENGTLWLEFPSIGGPSPDIPVRAKYYEDPRWFRHHSSRVQGKYNWIATSGVTGLREVSIRMFLQPGRNASKVDAFDKHIGQIPTWQEEQIKGVFEQPRPYTVRLYFAETEEYGIGRRLFNVSLQDRQVLEAFDIVKEAGGANRPVVKEFKGINVKDDLKVTLTPVTAGQASPLLCGIEIIAEGWTSASSVEP